LNAVGREIEVDLVAGVKRDVAGVVNLAPPVLPASPDIVIIMVARAELGRNELTVGTGLVGLDAVDPNLGVGGHRDGEVHLLVRLAGSRLLLVRRGGLPH
jgi:hypothetical protein